MNAIILILFALALIFIPIYITRNKKEPATPSPASQPQQPQRKPLTDAEREAIRQADEAFDLDTHIAIVNGTYTGPLPDYDGFYWSNIYPDLYHTKIAGINFRCGIRNLAGMYFDALLVAEPKNKHDPNAIKIIHAEDRRHLGYIPADETDDVRVWVNNTLPYHCRAHIDEFEDYDEEHERDITRLYGCINIAKNQPKETPSKSQL